MKSEPLQRLKTPLALEDGSSPIRARYVVIFAFVVIAGVTLWSGITTINEVTYATGEIRTASETRGIQHREGGVIEHLYVREGQKIKKYDLIARLRASDIVGNWSRLREEMETLEIELARVRAMLFEQELDDQSLPKDLDSDRIQRSLATFTSRRSHHTSVREVFLARIDQKEAELARLEEEIALARERSDILANLREIKSKIQDESRLTKIQTLESDIAVRENRARLRDLRAKIAGAGEAVAVAYADLVEFDAANEARLTERQAQLVEEIGIRKAKLETAGDRVVDLDLRAPADGILTNFTLTGIGQVIMPGEVVGNVVPTDERLLARVVISPQDVAGVRVGDAVRLSLSRSSRNGAGALRGILTRISGVASTASDGMVGFSARVEIMPDILSGSGREKNYILKPGIEVRAEIIAGERTILASIIQPLSQTWDTLVASARN